MKTTRLSFVSLLLLAVLLGVGCTGLQTETKSTTVPATAATIEQIDSFSPPTASRQAFEVIANNPYSEEFFARVFARLVEQCQSSTSPENANIIWENFIQPIKGSGKVPSDLATYTWNCYFSQDFVSLPGYQGAYSCCHQLADIRAALEKEYQLKQAGFAICRQGSPDSHFLNAMYVYNTLWASCHEAD